MAEDPIPVVVCSGLAGERDRRALRALDEGALAVVTKPQTQHQRFLHESAVVFRDAVRGAAAQARVRQRAGCTARRADGRRRPAPAARAGPGAHGRPLVAIGRVHRAAPRRCELIQKHARRRARDRRRPAHAGGIHARPSRTRLDGLCRMEVKEAADGDRVRPAAP